VGEARARIEAPLGVTFGTGLDPSARLERI
jgi:hypothetical protein